MAKLGPTDYRARRVPADDGSARQPRWGRRDPEARQVRVVRLIETRPHTLFQLLTDPQCHARLDGSGMLRGDPVGPDRLQLGATFTMGMSQAGKAYRSTNQVVEFEPDRRITWRSTGTWRGHTVVGGQRWRYILHPDQAGTLVEHAYVWGYARMPLLTVWLLGFPRRMGSTMERSLANLAVLAADRQRLGRTVSNGDERQ
jgi:uncharacterized protein YndB with AHSA1/START domain